MPEFIEELRDLGFAERYLGGWRVIASAWAMAMVIVMMFAGVEALASRHVTVPQHAALVGVVIPRHDPSCGGPGDVTAAATPDCPVASDEFARSEAQAEGEAEAAYGM
jgi:hypothetical protein